MDDASGNPASAILVGQESSVLRNYATPAAVTTVNARTAPASVYLGGTEDIAPWKDVLEDVLAMASAESLTMGIGSASALMDGMVLTALR